MLKFCILINYMHHFFISKWFLSQIDVQKIQIQNSALKTSTFF